MAFNRNKTLTKAQKLLQKGKVAEAVKEYQEIVDNDPTDIRTLLKIGDLQAKIGNIEAANDTYRKVAEHYAKDGFFLKAVAVFKQILKNDPNLIAVYIRLAELYQQLGLNSEAMKQYQVVVRHYENQGLKKESLDVLKKMAELDPENTASKIKLAELYAREGHQEAASEQLKGVAEGLRKKNNLQDLARVIEKMETLSIADLSAKHELSEIYLKTAEPKKALARLQELFQSDPKEPRTLELLARSFAELQQPEKAKSVYKELVSILDERGMLEERDRIKARLRAMGVSSSAPEAPAAPVEEAGVVDAEIVDDDIVSSPAAPAAAAPPEPAGASANELKLLQEAETFVKYGLIDKACDTLVRSANLYPESSNIRKKLIEAFQKRNDVQGLSAALSKIADTAASKGLTAVAEEIRNQLQPSSHVSAPVAPPVAAADGLDVELVDDSEVAETVSLEPESEGHETVSLEPEPETVEVHAESPGLDDVEEFERAEAPADDLDLDLDVEGESASVTADEQPETFELPASAEEPQIEPADAGGPSIELDFSLDLSPPEPEEAAPEPPAVLEPRVISKVVPKAVEPDELLENPEFERGESDDEDPFVTEMEEAQFFVEQGLLDEAKEVLETVLAQNPKYTRARTMLSEMAEVKPAISSPPPKGQPERRREDRPSKPSLVVDEVSSPIKKATSRVLAEKEQKSAKPEEALFNLSTELQDEIAELEEELSQPKKSDEEEFLSPEEVISEFKKGVARTVAKDDYQTHYNLGIAYKEMGLLDEAINEFHVASNDPKGGIECASMLGLCLMGKRDYGSAIQVYRKALAMTSPQAIEALALSYELAEAYLGSGNNVEAYKLFVRVRDIDPTFRDIRRRAKELEADMGSSPPSAIAPEKPTSPKPKAQEKEEVVEIPSKKNKISYI